MKWEKKGLIYGAEGKHDWDNNSYMGPLPLMVGNDVIRIYGTVRDKEGRGTLTYIEVSADNPSKILKINDKPLVQSGRPGMFDDNGIAATCIMEYKDEIRCYYAGYTLSTKVRHHDFTGLAISRDGGLSFNKYAEVPVLDRIPGEELTRAVQVVMYEDCVFKTYYVGGSSFAQGKTKTIPEYNLRYIESADGIHYPEIPGNVAIPVEEGFYRVGKPYIIKENGIYKMFYSDGGDEILYRLAYAESTDGITWTKKDMNFEMPEDGWDSQMQEYPSFLRVNGKAYLFYNGRNYGRDGFGYAELIEE